jgi:hypothetical protein
MNIFQHGIKKTFSIAALLCASVSSACYAAETVSTNQTMWDEWKNNPGFTEALDELGIDYNNLINPAYASTYDAQNVNNPLFWLNRTLKFTVRLNKVAIKFLLPKFMAMARTEPPTVDVIITS